MKAVNAQLVKTNRTAIKNCKILDNKLCNAVKYIEVQAEKITKQTTLIDVLEKCSTELDKVLNMVEEVSDTEKRMTKLYPKVQMMKDDVKELEKHVKQIAMENRIEACNEEIEAMEVIDVITDKYDARSGNIKNLERCTKKEIYQK